MQKPPNALFLWFQQPSLCYQSQIPNCPENSSNHHFLANTLCPPFVNERHTLLSILGNFNCSLLENTSKVLTQTLFFENMSLIPSNNSKILSATTDFILSTKRFDEQIL